MDETLGQRIAAEALALVGVPFRLRGRDPDTGLDCVGVALVALRRAGVSVTEPGGYQLRGTSLEKAAAMLQAAGLARAAGGARAGDLLLAASGPLQCHLMVRSAGGLVHAHAGLGRVVEMPLGADRSVIGIWRAGANFQASE